MTLDIADLADTFRASGATLTLTASGDDTLQITAPHPLDTPSALTPFTSITLTDGPLVLFRGWLDQAPREASPGEHLTYTFTGPSRWLHRRHPTHPSTGGQIRWAAPSTGRTPLPLADALRRLLDWLIADLPPSTIAYHTPDLDAPGLSHQIPVTLRVGDTYHTALTALLRYAPSFATRWDYTTTPPKLRILDTDTTTPSHTLDPAHWPLASLGINQRYDLLYSAVTIQWMRGGDKPARTDTATGAPPLPADRTLLLTLTTDNRYNLPAEGLAAALAAHHCTLHAEASTTIPRLDWTLLPAQVWTFGGILAGVTAKTFAHTITRDLLRHTTTIDLGIPPWRDIVPLNQTNADPPGSQPEEKTATITRTIHDPDSASVPDAYWFVNGQTVPSGSSATVPADTEHRIIYIVPPDYEPPDPETITLPPDGTSTATRTATYRHRLRLRRADGAPGEAIDLNVHDIPSGKGTLKLRSLWCLDTDGNPKRITIPATEPYNP